MATPTSLAVRNALYLATDKPGQRGLTPTQAEVNEMIAQLGEQGYAIVRIPTTQTITVHDPLGEVSTSVTFNGRGIFKMAAARLSLFKRSDIDQGALT